jgi:DNA-3-methyladenine glycosylase II
LTRRTLTEGVRVLSGRDTDLRRVVQRLGPPPMWARRPGFATLVYIILEQQVSLASAKATYDKLRHRLTRLTPRAFLALDAATLKRCGFSRQKTEYCRQLANSILQRQLVLRRLERADDSTAKAELIQIKGIGSWSADSRGLRRSRHPTNSIGSAGRGGRGVPWRHGYCGTIT